MKSLTVGKLKEALKNVPDDTIVTLISDTGADQGHCGGEVVVESAYYTHFSAGGCVVDSFDIYVSEYEEGEE